MLIHFGATTNHRPCEGLTDEIQLFYALVRPLRPDEMPDFPVQVPPPEVDDWFCLRCWKSGSSVFCNRPLDMNNAVFSSGKFSVDGQNLWFMRLRLMGTLPAVTKSQR